jgi:hypothetical protein
MNADQIERVTDDAAAEVGRVMDYVKRIAIDAEQRRERAARAGYELAWVVNRYQANPDDVGSDALRAAYQEFMSLHAGNFGPVAVDA